ncbi:MAG: hypothetical protein ACLPX1_09915 [Steroidobacteraceae bacterium]
MKLRLEARVSSDSPDAVGRMLVTKLSAVSVTRDGSDWIVRAEVESASARDATRELLSELRRVERKTRLRAEWTAGGSVEGFFDYVSKSFRKIMTGASWLKGSQQAKLATLVLRSRR